MLRDHSQYKLPFGKHKGKKLQDVPVDYLVTLLDHADWMYPKTRQVLIHWLGWLRGSGEPLLWSGEEALNVLRFALAAVTP